MNKYLSKDMFEILSELDLSHSGELMLEDNSAWIDNYCVKNKEALKDLMLLRLIKFKQGSTNQQIFKITDEGTSCLNNKDYVPVIARKPVY